MLLGQVNGELVKHITRVALKVKVSLSLDHKRPVIEKYKLPPIEIFDKNCPLKRVNQKFAIFRQNVRKLELIW